MIRFEHLSEAQKRACVLADNQLALQAGRDDALLAEELAWLSWRNRRTRGRIGRLWSAWTLPGDGSEPGGQSSHPVTHERRPTCSASVAHRTRAQPQSSWRCPPDPRCVVAAPRASRRPCS